MAPSSPEIFTESLEKLVRKFDADKHHYLSKDCSEAQARIDFITPFFKALGWDLENEAGLPHHERALQSPWIAGAGLLVSQGRHRVDLRCPARREVACQSRCRNQHERDQHEGDGIGRA